MVIVGAVVVATVLLLAPESSVVFAVDEKPKKT